MGSTMGEEQQLDATIAKLEQELQQLKHQLENNSVSAAANASAASADPTADESQQEQEQQRDEDPASAFRDWSQQQAGLDDELEGQLRARLATADEVSAELEEHVGTMERVSANRRRGGLDAVGLRQRIRQRHHEQRRLHEAIRRELNKVLRTIHHEEGYITIQRLLDRLLTRFEDTPDDPYVPVTRDIFPEHLAMLERAGIVRYQSGTGERRVRLVDHAVNLKLERIVPEQRDQEMTDDDDAETDEL